MQVLASVPDLDIVAYLPLFLSSLMDCLTDPLSDVRSKAAKVLQVAVVPLMVPASCIAFCGSPYSLSSQAPPKSLVFSTCRTC